jgi:nucleotide-binding universal stress UspA family protein
MAVLAVATDFSTRSDRAIRRAEMLAAGSGRELVLIHVIDEDQPDRIIKAHREQAEAILGELRDTLGSGRGLVSRVDIRIGQVFEEIPQAAAAAGADLIVLGPHRPQMLRDVIRGKTLERTVRRSKLPVLIANAFPAADYCQVLLTTTLEPRTAASTLAATSLTYFAKADFLLLHVYESVLRDVQGRSMMASDRDEADRAEETVDMRRKLAAFAADEGLPAGRLTVRAATGPVGTEILKVADEVEADLVVAARSEKGVIEAAFTGRASDALLSDATRDVLIVPVE